MISSIRLNGEPVCMGLDSATRADVFRPTWEPVLAPTLRSGNIVVLDNLSGHKDKSALRIIEQAGARVKQLLQAMKTRSKDSVHATIGAALSCITEADANGWVVSCGYSLN